jgi:hypothetical protein
MEEGGLSDLAHRYLELKRKLKEWRVDHPEDTPEEDAILDEMDFVWDDLAQEERDWLEAHFRKAP